MNRTKLLPSTCDICKYNTQLYKCNFCSTFIICYNCIHAHFNECYVAIEVKQEFQNLLTVKNDIMYQIENDPECATYHALYAIDMHINALFTTYKAKQ